MLAFRNLLPSLARTRAAVDSVARETTRRVIVQATVVGAEAIRRVADAKAPLNTVKQQLDTEPASLTGGLIGLPTLPGT